MQDNLQQLKSVIQAAVPSIMELKFGCEVKVLFDDSDYYGKAPKEWVKTTIYEVSPKGAVIRVIPKQINDIDVAKRTEAGELKILGRPIRLADVLLASKEEIAFTCFEGSYFGIDFDCKRMDGKRIEWNLADDNLDNQSPECQEFLINLLCK